MFLDFPLGHTTGPRNDADMQRQLLADGLTIGMSIDSPGTIVDLPYRWSDDRWKADPLSWSRKAQDAGTTGQAAGDTRTSRNPEPQYQSDEDRRAAENRS